MRYRKFGNTGLFVSQLCLGTMTFGGEGELWSQIGDLQQANADKLIVGAKRIDQLDDNIAATNVRLSDDELAKLETVSALPSEYPGWMFERQGEYRRQQLAQSRER